MCSSGTVLLTGKSVIRPFPLLWAARKIALSLRSSPSDGEWNALRRQTSESKLISTVAGVYELKETFPEIANSHYRCR